MDLKASFRGRAVISLSGIEDREFKGKAAILVKGPDKVRIEIFDILGQVAAIIVSDADALSIFSNNDSNFYSREASTPLIFSAPELAAFLMGIDERQANLSSDKERVEAGVEVEARSVLFEDFRELKGARFPFSLTVDDGKERLLVRYSSIEINPELDDSLFNHILPKPPRLPISH
jgi:outer membrane lipoprotein-sorting protein